MVRFLTRGVFNGKGIEKHFEMHYHIGLQITPSL